jgi:hypothetical protein
VRNYEGAIQLGGADCATTLPVTSVDHKQGIFFLKTFILAAHLGQRALHFNAAQTSADEKKVAIRSSSSQRIQRIGASFQSSQTDFALQTACYAIP